MRPLARELVVGAVVGLAVVVWLATHDKVDPPICYGCRGRAVAHVAWGWTIGAAVVVALATAGCACALRGRRPQLVVPRWRGARHLAVTLITAGALAVGGVLVVGVLSAAPWNVADLRP